MRRQVDRGIVLYELAHPVECLAGGVDILIKKTNAEPSIVPSNGMSSPMTIVVVMIVYLYA